MNIRFHVEAEGYVPRLIKARPDGVELYDCRAAAVRRLKRGSEFRVRLALRAEVEPGYVGVVVPIDGTGNGVVTDAVAITDDFDEVEVVVRRKSMRRCALMERGEHIVRILVVPDRRRQDAEDGRP